MQSERLLSHISLTCGFTIYMYFQSPQLCRNKRRFVFFKKLLCQKSSLITAFSCTFLRIYWIRINWVSEVEAPEYPAIAATFGNFPLESLISQLRLDLNWKAPSKITSRGSHLRSEIKGNEKKAQFQL